MTEDVTWCGLCGLEDGEHSPGCANAPQPEPTTKRTPWVAPPDLPLLGVKPLPLDRIDTTNRFAVGCLGADVVALGLLATTSAPTVGAGRPALRLTAAAAKELAAWLVVCAECCELSVGTSDAPTFDEVRTAIENA